MGHAATYLVAQDSRIRRDQSHAARFDLVIAKFVLRIFAGGDVESELSAAIDRVVAEEPAAVARKQCARPVSSCSLGVGIMRPSACESLTGEAQGL